MEAAAPESSVAHGDMRARYAAVVDTLNVYFDGLYFSDVSRLERVLHPQAHYVCAVESELIYYRMEEYFPVVKQRPSPASRSEVRKDKIVAIEFAGPVTAFARVECAIGPKSFIDLLTLIFTCGQWWIISKVFHYDLALASA